MLTAKLSHNWKPVQSVTAPAPTTTGDESWYKLKPQVQLHDVPRVQLTQEEVDAIDKHCDKFFNKEQIVDKGKYIYPSMRGVMKANPNARGIRGEFALLRYFSPHFADITSFLTDRPWAMRDMGDAIIIGRTAKIFDTKTRARRVGPDKLIADDTYMAELDAKFADPDRYGYIECFIFCASHIEKNQVYIMGWMEKEEYLDHAEEYPAGREIPHAGFGYGNDTLCIPYRRLRPITALTGLPVYPITANMSIEMREDYDIRHIRPIDGKRYIQDFAV